LVGPLLLSYSEESELLLLILELMPERPWCGAALPKAGLPRKERALAAVAGCV